jgi:predicted histone-like DNA-binding protein
MAYFYRTRKKCYIKNEAKEEKFFAVPVTKGTLGMEEIAKEISSKSIAKESAILAVLKELSIIMKNKLGDGYNLKLDGIGTFGVAITSLGFDKEENITPRRVKFSKMTYHTDARWWITLEPAQYKKQKSDLESLLKKHICDTLSITEAEILKCFSATPKTFKKYIHRSQLGGNALTFKNLLPRLPSNDTPIKGLYQVGDTAYAAQGWPGVVMGVMNCARLIHG